MHLWQSFFVHHAKIMTHSDQTSKVGDTFNVYAITEVGILRDPHLKYQPRFPTTSNYKYNMGLYFISETVVYISIILNLTCH